MADADSLLHDAQYAFSCITFGDSPDNRRHAARAKSLCNKIIRRFPASFHADEAHAILRRLGEEAYVSKMPARHRHVTQAKHHADPKPLARPRASRPVPAPRASQPVPVQSVDEDVRLDWGGLVAIVLGAPKVLLIMIFVAAAFLYGIFGPLLVVPLVVLVLLTGPFRSTLKREQRRQMNEFVRRVNAYIAERR